MSKRPAPEDPDAASWAAEVPDLQDRVWESLQVLKPVDSEGRHPFVLMLNHGKGKKVLPRCFPHLAPTRQLTVLTRLFFCIDGLDVVSHGLDPNQQGQVDLFCKTVLQPIVHLISQLEFARIIDLASLLANHDIEQIARTRVGQTFLTVLVSRAELIGQQDSDVSPEDVEAWQSLFQTIFQRLQPHLGSLFDLNDTSSSWHLLASLALGADLNHQRLLLDAVRDRIFGAMSAAREDPSSAEIRISNLNMFLNVMGLNATTETITELTTT